MIKKMGGSLLSTLTLQPLSATPLYRQLEMMLRQLIITEKLPSGARLPSTRSLAKDLGVSRLTTKNVYEQLKNEGFLVSKSGSGTFVSDLKPDLAPPKRKARSKSKKPRATPKTPHMRKIETSNSTIRLSGVHAFRPGIPSLDSFPKQAWARAYRRAIVTSGPEAFGFGPTNGVGALKQAIAEHVIDHRGIDCTAEQIIITSGEQNALHLIAMTLLSHNDTVLTENPGQIATRDSMMSQGLEVVAVPVDSEGLNISVAQEVGLDIKAAFLTPSHQHPFGIATSLARRLELIEFAKTTGCWIIEDDFQCEFHYEDRPLPAMFALDRYDQVIYVNSFAETMFPGISLGYLICPKSLVNLFSTAVSLFSQPVPVIKQIAMAEFISDGSFNAHMRRMKPLYRRRRDLLISALKKHAKDILEIAPCRAGHHLIVRFDDHIEVSDTIIAEALWDAGIECVPLSVYFCPPAEFQHGLLLGFACAREEEIEALVVRLAYQIRQNVELHNPRSKLKN